jgi:hypothetical protein
LAILRRGGDGVKINLHIDRLVLDGIPVARIDSGRVRAAVERELTRLLASGGLDRELKSGAAIPSLHAEKIRIDKLSRPDDVGRAIARSVHGKIGGKR